MAEQSYEDWIRSNPPLPTKEYKHMAQQTALMDLIIALQKFVELDGVCPDTIEAVIEFAANRLEMEKEQTVDAYKHGQNNEFSHLMVGKLLITGEEYYEQTYKTQPHDKQQS